MKNKGFTLIELLAVIVILAIIALIATPIILGIINDARKSARERSAELGYTAVEYAVTSYLYDNDGIADGLNLSELSNYFQAENVVYAATSNTTATISEKGDNGKKLCDVTLTNGEITVNCGEYFPNVTGNEKTIPVTK